LQTVAKQLSDFFCLLKTNSYHKQHPLGYGGICFFDITREMAKTALDDADEFISKIEEILG